MRRLALLLALCLVGPALAAPARKPRPEPPPQATGSAAETIASLPPLIGIWRRTQSTDFSARAEGAGLGVSVEYRPIAGGSGVVTVYAYDRGQAAMRNGIAAPEVATELATAQQEIATLAPYRAYQVTARGGGPEIPAPDGKPALRCETTLLAFSAGPMAEAVTCVGVHDGRFLKLRMTMRAGVAGAAQQMALDFGRELLAVAR
jgi:hypothetical protein